MNHFTMKSAAARLCLALTMALALPALANEPPPAPATDVISPGLGTLGLVGWLRTMLR